MEIIIVLAVGAYSFYFMKKVLKQTKKDGPLTKNEKIQIIITLFLNSIVSWAIYYFGWKEKLPQKAKQVNKYLFIMIGMLVAIAVIGILLAILVITINPLQRFK